MPANFRKEGRTFKSKNGLVEYQYGEEYIDDREMMMMQGGAAADAGDFRKRPFKNGGPTNFELAQRGMGGSLNPVTSARSGRVVPG